MKQKKKPSNVNLPRNHSFPYVKHYMQYMQYKLPLFACSLSQLYYVRNRDIIYKYVQQTNK